MYGLVCTGDKEPQNNAGPCAVHFRVICLNELNCSLISRTQMCVCVLLFSSDMPFMIGFFDCPLYVLVNITQRNRFENSIPNTVNHAMILGTIEYFIINRKSSTMNHNTRGLRIRKHSKNNARNSRSTHRITAANILRRVLASDVTRRTTQEKTHTCKRKRSQHFSYRYVTPQHRTESRELGELWVRMCMCSCSVFVRV